VDKPLLLFRSVDSVAEARLAMERLLAQCQSSNQICDESLHLLLAHK
jgi:hypothetical protein